jgi:catechol 2,3-dioxygenase-like lactoylglutathione lyase family enzyme
MTDRAAAIRTNNGSAPFNRAPSDTMSATRVNHVSVSAPDLEASQRFYTGLFGAQPIPAPNFGFPVRWLSLGETQLHLFESAVDAPSHHHFALTVEDLRAIYRRAGELGVYDSTAFGHHLFELPGDVSQLYLRDPGGNLVEVDSPHASGLPDSIRRDMKRLGDVHPQDADNLLARLNLGAP